MKLLHSAYQFEENDFLLISLYPHIEKQFLQVIIYRDYYNKVFFKGNKFRERQNKDLYDIRSVEFSVDFEKLNIMIKQSVTIKDIAFSNKDVYWLLTKKEAIEIKNKLMLGML